MSITAAFPRTQHWTTGPDGFRISVLLYKSSRETCTVCGRSPARHYVSADGRGLHEGFRASAHFCDADRPPKGPLPPLDYKRLAQGAGLLSGGVPTAVIYERLAPYPEHPCAECGDPALFEITENCPGCGDPAQQYLTRLTSLTADGPVDGGTQVHHRLHATREWWACAGHSPALAGAA
jgi:hypothetical protein